MLKFTGNDKSHITEFIADTHQTRVSNRSYFDKQIKEIDRQIRMEPESRVRLNRDGSEDKSKAWMPEAELPLQSQTLEVTSADTMRMLLPRTGPWFEAHAAMTDELLERVDFTSLIMGDENDIPSKMNQDSIDKMVYGLMNYWHSQYGFRSHLGLITGESIKYSMGVGRALVVNRRITMHTSRGVVKKDMDIPMLVPRSIKNTFLDDSETALMNEGLIVAPGHIFEKTMKIKDVQMASEKGNDNVNDMTNGGWVKGALKGIEGDSQGNVQFLEWEGDMVVPRKTTGSLYLPNSVITMIIGHKGKDVESRMVRIRKNKHPFSSYIGFPYHQEHIDTPYGSSPCMKGRPVHAATVNALNVLMTASAYNAEPAIRHDADTAQPEIFPGAFIESDEPVDVLQIGDPSALFAVYAGLNGQYADVTAVNAPRLGAQTVSHTTAFSKDIENQRGQARTVDFVDDTLAGPLSRWLDIEYELGKSSMKGDVSYMIPQWKMYVTVNKKMLPKEVSFNAHGAGGPAEEAQKKQEKMAVLNQAIQLDTLKMQQQMQLGQQPTPKVDVDAAIENLLSEGGWTDVDAITTGAEPAQGATNQGGVAPSAGGNQGLASTVIQAQAFGGKNA